MAGPKTLEDEMSDGDLLELKCSACEWSYDATKRQAIKRFGPRACIVVVNMTSVCPNCGTKGDVWGRLLPRAALKRLGGG